MDDPRAMNLGIANAKLTTVKAEEHVDSALEIGNYELSSATGNQLGYGNYVVIWKRQGDRWLLHRDIWNTSQRLGKVKTQDPVSLPRSINRPPLRYIVYVGYISMAIVLLALYIPLC